MTTPSLNLPSTWRTPIGQRAIVRYVAERRWLLVVLGAFLTTRLIACFVIFVSSATIPMREGNRLYASPDNLIFDGLIRDDAWWYNDIIVRGYNLGDPAAGVQGNVAFFPLYPLIVKMMAFVIGNVFAAGLIVSNICFAIALLYIYRLAQREWDDATASRAVWYVASAPTAIFFASMYTESLFVACVSATFFYARERRWRMAAVAGALGSATRNTGILLAVVVALEGLHAAGVRWWPTRWNISVLRAHFSQIVRVGWHSRTSLIAASCVSFGLLSYMAYLANAFGDPLAFIRVQAAWGRDISGAGIVSVVPDTSAQLAAGRRFWAGQVNIYLLLDLLFALGFGALTIATAFKLRPAYGAFAGLTFLTPLATGTIGSMTRYVLMLLPCFLLLAVWGRRAWLDRIILGIFLPLFAYFTVVFSHWYFAG